MCCCWFPFPSGDGDKSQFFLLASSYSALSKRHSLATRVRPAMIARRLGAAVRQPQSIGCATRSSCAVASTSYAHHHRSHPSNTRSLASSSSSSSRGPFSPSVSRFKKNRAAVLSELPAEEPFEDYENEDGDLFDIDEEQQVIKPAKKTKQAVQEFVPFSEMKESILQRFSEMDPEEAVSVDLGDWSRLVKSAKTAEELKQCLEVSLEWKNKTYSPKSKMQKLTPKETGIIARRALSIRCSKVMFDALMDRKHNGLEYDVDVMRHLQASPLESDHAALASSSKEDNSDSRNGAPDQIETLETSMALSKVDRSLALAAYTSVLSPSHADVDAVTLILAIGHMIKLFELGGQVPSGKEELYKSQVYPRLGRALTALAATRDGVFQGTYPLTISQKQYFSARCEKVLQVAISKRQKVDSQYDVEKVNKRLASAMRACGPELHSQFVKKAERTFATSTV